MRYLLIVFLWTLSCAAGPGLTKQELYAALARAPEVELCTLDPNGGLIIGPHAREQEAAYDKAPKVGGYVVLGSVKLKGKEKQEVLAAFQQGIDEKKDSDRALCFIPRHGLRARVDGQVYEVVICFQCLQIQVSGSQAGKKRELSLLTTPSAQPVFDAAAARYHLKAAPRP